MIVGGGLPWAWQTKEADWPRETVVMLGVMVGRPVCVCVCVGREEGN